MTEKHITRIHGEAIKGARFTYPAAPFTFISGPNRAGKTTIFEAVQLALSGGVPDVKASETFSALASAPSMSAEAIFGDAGIKRTWTANGTGGASASVDVIGEFSPDDVEEIPLLNASAYFAMTESQRVAYALKFCELPASLSANGVVARLQKAVSIEDHSEEFEDAKVEILGLFREAIEAANVAAGIAEFVRDGGVLKTEFTKHNRKQKETIGAVRTITELRLREGECSAETLREIEDAIHRQTNAITELGEKLAALHERRNARARKEARRLELNAILRQPEPEDNTAAATQELAVLEAKLKALDLPADDDDLRATNSRLNRDAVQAQGAAQAAIRKTDALKEEIANLDDHKGEGCPKCKNKKPGWDKIVREALNAALEVARKESTAAVMAESNATAAANESNDKYSARQQARRDEQALYSRIQGLKTTIATYASNKRLYDQSQESARKELNAGGELGEEIAELELIPGMERDRDALKGLLESSKLRLREAQRLAQDIQRAAQAELEHLKEKAFVDVINLVKKELLDVQKEILVECFGKLLVNANILTNGVMPKLEFQDGMPGYYRETKEGPRWVSFRTFSGLERTIGFIAIAAGLSATSLYRGVCIDEFENLTPAMQEKVMTVLEDAVNSGLLDQVFVIKPTDEPDPRRRGCPRGWQHIAL